jgi:hypothetical protein
VLARGRIYLGVEAVDAHGGGVFISGEGTHAHGGGALDHELVGGAEHCDRVNKARRSRGFVLLLEMGGRGEGGGVPVGGGRERPETLYLPPPMAPIPTWPM